MNEIQINLPLSVFQEWAIATTRYRMTRCGHMSFSGVGDVKRYWTMFTSRTRKVIQNDIEQFLQDYDHWKQDEDLSLFYNAWQNLLAWIKTQKHQPTPHQSYVELPIISQEKCNAKQN
ncbi:hypothetical protein [Lonepinella sp. BR2474]|uniref:hypothetical protein n=1 Tax=Lonepinella sp. BR2474 TaxID=3434548 RepID=UPI003F6DCE56